MRLVFYIVSLASVLSFQFPNRKLPSSNELSQSSRNAPNLQLTRNIFRPMSTIQDFDEVPLSLQNVLEKFEKPFQFLLRAGAIGLTTGLGVVLLKNLIYETQGLLYEGLADILPKPAFYWPIALYPFIGATFVSVLTYFYGPSIWNGLDNIAKSIDANSYVAPMEDSLFFDLNTNATSASLPFNLPIDPAIKTELMSQESMSMIDTSVVPNATTSISLLLPNTTVSESTFSPVQAFLRLLGAVTTLGSGCSLGPEGPSVEIGATWSRVFADPKSPTSTREKHHLFLAGTAAGVAAGFGAPIAGVFFALECGNRCLARNTVKLDEDASDAPRTDIAAIVLAATLSNLMVQLLLQKKETLLIQGNSYAMVSPFFELPVYLGLAIISGLVSVIFDNLKEFFVNFYKTNDIPKHIRPILGGLACGLIAIFFPQTLFNGYISVGDLMSSSSAVTNPYSFFLLMQILMLKLLLSSFSLVSGLVGGVFAPALFWGAASGAAYHYLVSSAAAGLQQAITAYAFDIANVLHGLQDSWHAAVASAAPLHLGSASAYVSHVDTGVTSGLSDQPFHLSAALTSRSNSLMADEQLIRSIKQFFTISNSQAYATVGAAATLGAVFRAPLTSCMLIFELTQNHETVLPVLFSTGLGGFFAEIVRKKRKSGSPPSS